MVLSVWDGIFPGDAGHSLSLSLASSQEQFEGATGHYPAKEGILRQIAPERLAKTLSHSFFVVSFLSPKYGLAAISHGFWALGGRGLLVLRCMCLQGGT